MDKETIQLQNRFRDLADKSYAQNIYVFTGFLSLAEQDIFLKTAGEISHVSYRLFGGRGDCERKMLRFGSPEDLGYEEDFPIVCIHICPLLKKFADDFTHRDFLGALMHLGIERNILGDIFMAEQEAFLFCQEAMSSFICEKLDKVKHTHVRCEILREGLTVPVKEPQPEEVTVSSQRADGIVARLYGLAREKSQKLFADKKVYIDGRLAESPSRCLKSGELVTVRGYGRFLYQGVCYETKKGKLCIKADVYR